MNAVTTTSAANSAHTSPTTGAQASTQSDALSDASTGSRTSPSASPDQLIDTARGEIDTLDDRIIDLVRERVAVSARIQQTRIAAGGRRVNLAREMEILNRYHSELGKPGTALAMTLLELSRGRA